MTMVFIVYFSILLFLITIVVAICAVNATFKSQIKLFHQLKSKCLKSESVACELELAKLLLYVQVANRKALLSVLPVLLCFC